MKIRLSTVLKAAGIAVLLILALGLAVPHFNAGPYGERLRTSLERALGRPVEFQGPVRFSLFSGPGFSVENVVIHEDPSIGLEPIAYMDSLTVRPGFWSLLTGRFVIASVRLDGNVSINLTKSGPAAESGRWNFSSFIDRSIMSRVPALHIRQARIHFKFGDDKSVFYLTDTDLDITPPSSAAGGWDIDCSATAARTDRSAQGLGAFTLKGRWYVAPERVDLNLEVDRSGLAEITALLRGQAGGVHGSISSRLHLAGPIHQIGILGRLTIQDVHRWDLMPPHGQGWPLDIRGRLDLVSQQLELQSASSSQAALPLWVRFRASDYLSQPHWALAVNWNRFPVGPVMELAQHMGAQLPSNLQLNGTIDGAVGYSGQGIQGELALHDTAVTIPDSPPLRFEQAHIVLDQGRIHLNPTLVRSGDDQAHIEGTYQMNQEIMDLSISTESMTVASLRAQVALAAVPLLEQVQTGTWNGHLNYHREPLQAAWTGDLQVTEAEIPVPGLAHPVQLTSAHAQLDGPHVLIDHIRARAGKVNFTGDYSYQPDSARPHRFKLRAQEWDLSDVETECMPTLRRSSSLLQRALGRTTVPEWMSTRGVDGTLQVDNLILLGAKLQNFHSRVIWDGTRVELDGLQARLDRAAFTGKLAVNLRGAYPAYKLTGQMKGLNWQSGKLDADGTLETSGTGRQLLANLLADGAFTGTALDFGQPSAFRVASGNYSMVWSQGAPRFKLTSLNFRTEEDLYTGRGATQDDGRLLLVLSNGARELRLSGPAARLKLEEAVR